MIRHTILMDALRLAAEHGVELAFPTQTVHIGDSAQLREESVLEEEE